MMRSLTLATVAGRSVAVQVKIKEPEADDIFTKLMGDVVEPRRELVLDEFAARLDHVAHQLGEDVVGLVDLLDLDLYSNAAITYSGQRQASDHAAEPAAGCPFNYAPRRR